MTTGSLAPADLPSRLVELSTDARAAVLLDGVGEASGCSEADRAESFAEAARELLRAVDRAADTPPQELEATVAGGSVYAVRSPRWSLVTIARRSALSSLMLSDMRMLLSELEA